MRFLKKSLITRVCRFYYIYIGLININEICLFIYIMIKISFFPYKYKHVVVIC
jgi:hypothetical protein